YGFSAAARTYFGKGLADLTLGEAAMLAGLPKAPSAYNPVSNLRRATLRQQYVLRRMLDAGFIDHAEFEVAREEPLRLASGRTVTRTTSGDYVSEMARQIAFDQFGEDAYHLGIKIVTTIS